MLYVFLCAASNWNWVTVWLICCQFAWILSSSFLCSRNSHFCICSPWQRLMHQLWVKHRHSRAQKVIAPLCRDKRPCSPADTSITELYNEYKSKEPGWQSKVWQPLSVKPLCCMQTKRGQPFSAPVRLLQASRPYLGKLCSSLVGTFIVASGGSPSPKMETASFFFPAAAAGWMAGRLAGLDGWMGQADRSSRQFHFPSALLVQHQHPFHSPTSHLLVHIQTCWISSPISMFQSV